MDETVPGTLDADQPDDPAGAWLSLADYAAGAGISPKTARRRLKLGTLKGRQVGTQHGPAWQVWVPGRVDGLTTVDVEGTRQATQLDQGPVAADLVRLVDKLTQQNLELAGRVGYLQAELQQAREQLALAAPRVADQSTREQSTSAAVDEPAPRPWWRFWG